MRNRGNRRRLNSVINPEEEEHDHWGAFRKTLPYMCPAGAAMKCRVFLAIFFLTMSTLTPLIQPVFLKFIIDDLIARKFPIQWVIAYGGARFAGSLFVELRNIVWANVSALQERDIALQTFVHLQALSLEWHLNRKTGSVLRSISRGASSFSTVLRILMFSIFPVFIQVIVVSSYFFATYQWYFGVITFCVILVYVCFTFSVTEWRNKFRREMNEKDNEFNQKGTDALLNFQTVKYFNAESHEANRYDESLQAFRAASIISQQTLAILNGGQSFVISLGVTIVMILAAALVKNGEHTVGDFVLLQQYIITLYQPLGFLGSYYRMMKQTLVDVESMFNLWNQKPEIQNDPDAVELRIKDCRIEFNDVVFSYPKDPDRRVLDGVSFVVEPGQKVAIVGSTGAGKSTISRLLYRFYDLKSGSIMIDGQDISLVTVHSLRSHIGIVPQDCVLFNDTIGYNIGYGVYGYNPKGPTQNDIENAARAANIHDFIVKQPNGYEQRVGERGLRLSGGEKQRVAIARAILKRPEIMIFDEATSALDTKTEQQIQKELDQAAQGRTSLTIAHRLSTIMNSDQILVLKNGFIVERGTHDELLEMRGEYHEMWRLQEEHERLKEALADVVQAQKRHSESALVKQASTESE